jgi:O-antigen/teichoic acid export membrane protein
MAEPLSTRAPEPSPAIQPEGQDRFFRTDAVRSDIKRRTIRGGLVTALSQVVKQVLAIGSVILLSRLLSPADTGLVAMVIVIIGFNNLISDLGLSVATIQRPEIDQAQASTLFWLNVALGLALTIITALAAPAVAWFYREPRLNFITVVISVSFLIGGLSVQHRALLRRQMRFTPLAVIEVATGIISTLVGVVAAVMGAGYWALVYMQLAMAPVQLIGSWIACPWKPSPPRWAEGVRSMISFGANLTGFRIVNYISRNIDNVLIGFFYGATALGLYARAYSLLLLPLGRINEPLAAVAVPALSRLVEEPERYRSAYRRIVSSLCMVTMPLVALMVGASHWVVLVLLGEQWLSAAPIFALLGISGLIEPFLYTFSWIFTSQARTSEQFQWGIVNTVLTVVAICIGLPWGPEGVAAAYGISGLLVRAPISFWFVGRRGPVNVRFLVATVAPFAAASLAIVLGLWIFRSTVPISSAIVGLACATGLTILITLLVLLASPAGRAALLDIQRMPKAMLNRRR